MLEKKEAGTVALASLFDMLAFVSEKPCIFSRAANSA
jgi:hypothetical protein